MKYNRILQVHKTTLPRFLGYELCGKWEMETPANKNDRPVQWGWYEKAKLRKEILDDNT